MNSEPKEVMVLGALSSEFALQAYDLGFYDAKAQIVKEIDAEIERLSTYGRTELYGLHKTKSFVLDLK